MSRLETEMSMPSSGAAAPYSASAQEEEGCHLFHAAAVMIAAADTVLRGIRTSFVHFQPAVLWPLSRINLVTACILTQQLCAVYM